MFAKNYFIEITNKLFNYTNKKKSDYITSHSLRNAYFQELEKKNSIRVDEVEKISNYFKLDLTTILHFCDDNKFTLEQVKELAASSIFEFDKHANANADKSKSGYERIADLQKLSDYKQSLMSEKEKQEQQEIVNKLKALNKERHKEYLSSELNKQKEIIQQRLIRCYEEIERLTDERDSISKLIEYVVNEM